MELMRKDVEAGNGEIVVGGKKIKSLTEPDPTKLPWKDLGVDIVLECSGVFTNGKARKSTFEAGAKKVILSAPPKGEIFRFIFIGVNEKEL